MNVRHLFEKAASLLKGPENYDPRTPLAVINPDTTTFSITGLLERANCRDTSAGKVRGDPAVLNEAKALLCRNLHAIHLDGWEGENKPNWKQVRALFWGMADC